MATSDILQGTMFAGQVAITAAYAGRLPKAQLFVRKKDSGGASVDLDSVGVSTSDDVAALRSLIMGGSGTTSALKKVASKAGQASGTGADLIADTAKNKMKGAALEAELKAKNFVSMTVQYNPSSIRLMASGGAFYNYEGAGDKAVSQVSTFDKPSTVHFYVTLIFEDINDQDAFGYQDIALNIGTGIELGKSIYQNVTGKGYSVRPQVEALISLLMHKRTQQVIFYWSEMFFHGMLTNVEANYTMFNKKGHPIRAEVQLKLQQSDSNSMFPSDVKAWDGAFDTAFPDK